MTALTQRFLLCFVIAFVAISLGCGGGTSLVAVDSHTPATPQPSAPPSPTPTPPPNPNPNPSPTPPPNPNPNPNPTPPPGSQPTPILEAIVYPTSATAGGAGFSLSVRGTGFTSRSVILWNGSPRSTGSTLTLATQYLFTDIAASDLIQPGIVRISVRNPADGSLPETNSNTLDFPIFTLHLISASPASLAEGSAAMSVQLTGRGFTSDMTVNWNGTPKTTTFVNDSTLTFDLAATDLAVAGIAVVSTGTGGTSGLTSNQILISIDAPGLGPVERISQADNGQQSTVPSTSPGTNFDGRVVAYVSDAPFGYKMIVRDTCANAALSCQPSQALASIDAQGREIAEGVTYIAPTLTPDGRFVAFSTFISYITGDFTDVGIRDTCFGVVGSCTPSTSIPAPGPLGYVNSNPSLSDDARYVALTRSSPDLYYYDESNIVFTDTCRGAIGSCNVSQVLGARTGSGNLADVAMTSRQSLSSDGRFLLFEAESTPTPGEEGLWLMDSCLGVASGCTPSSTRVDVMADGSNLDATGSSFALSATARYVAFTPSEADRGAVYLRDTCIGAATGCSPTTTLLSVNSSGGELTGTMYNVSISAEGRKVAFTMSTFDGFSQSSPWAVYVRDTCVNVPNCTPKTILASESMTGSLPNDSSYEGFISGDGHYVVFRSDATDLVANDTNGVADIFRRRIN